MQGIDGAKRLKVKFNTYSLGKYFFFAVPRRQNAYASESMSCADGRMTAL